MILVEARVDGFGRLVEERVKFEDGLTVVGGPNESGKTTLLECILRILYGFPEAQYSAELERYRPWSTSAPYAAALVYRLDDGRVYETRRNFARAEVPTETFEREVMRPIADLSGTRKTSPGSDLLHLSKDAFEAAAVVRAGEFTGRANSKAAQALAERIAELVGSAGDASAAGALKRLDDLLEEVGKTDRATSKLIGTAHARSESARKALSDFRAEFERMREALAERARVADEREHLLARRAELDVRSRRARLRELRERIKKAEEAQAALADAERSAGGISAVPELLAGAGALDTAIDEWRAATAAANDAAQSSQAKESERSAVLQRIDDCQRTIKEAEADVARHGAEIEQLRKQVGASPISAEALDHLEQLNDLYDQQDASARAKEARSSIARQRPQSGALLSIAITLLALIAIGAGIALQMSAGVPLQVNVGTGLSVNPLIVGGGLALLAGVGFFIQFIVSRRRRQAEERRLQEEATQARALADAAAANRDKECAALGVSDVRSARRARPAQSDLDRHTAAFAAAKQLIASASDQKTTLEARFADFDRLDKQLVSARSRAEAAALALTRHLDDAHVPSGSLEARIAAFRKARQGFEGAVMVTKAAGQARLELAAALRGVTFEQLRLEAEALAARADAAPERGPADGPVAPDSTAQTKPNPAEEVVALQAELDALGTRLHANEKDAERLNGILSAFEQRHPGGGARLEEQLAASEVEEQRFTRARAAAMLARSVIETAKDSVHKDFAPALNALAGPALAQITGGRYAEASIDPRDFAVRVRAPETSAIVDMGSLSSGTQEQLYLALRAATAQALASGERVPLLLDDALAHADEARLRAAILHLQSIAKRQQVIFFTQREAVLAAANELDGISVVRLHGPAAATR